MKLRKRFNLMFKHREVSSNWLYRLRSQLRLRLGTVASLRGLLIRSWGRSQTALELAPQ